MGNTVTTQQSPTGETSNRRDWLVLLLASLGKLGIFTLASFLIWSLIPLVFGMAVTTVASGSMEPRIGVGDVVAAAPVPSTSLREKQVILFEDPAVPGRLRLHRIRAISEAGIQTKGDANPSPDTMLVQPEAVRGVGFVRVPLVGVPINWIHEGEWLFLGLFLSGLGMSAAIFNLDRDLRRRDREATVLDLPAVQPQPKRCPKLKDRPPFLVRHGLLSQHGFSDGFSPRGLAMPLVASLVVAVTVVYILGTSSAVAAFSSSTSTLASIQAAASFAKPWDQATFHWSYDEQAPNLGLALDDAGSTVENGTLAGGVVRATEDGDPYVTLNGSTGQIYSGRFSGAAPNTFSIETWFRTTTTRGGKLIGYGNSQSGASTSYDRHLYMTDSGKLTFGLQQPGFLGLFSSPVTVSTPGSYNDGGWHLATVTMSASSGSTIYVDGVAVASNGSMTMGQSTSGGYWRVGYDSISNSWAGSPTSKYFAGSLDDTSLYPTALTAAQVADHFAYGR